jgi:hypothetical protein
MNEINTIICDVITDEEFDRLQDADYDPWDLDRRVARNGLARLTRRLAKYGLTVAEWDAWSV